MQTDFKVTNKLNGVEEDVLSLTFNPTFVIATTRTQSVRFEKLEGGLMNENFVLEEGHAVTLESEAVVEEAMPEPTPEESNTPETVVSTEPTTTAPVTTE